MSERSRGIMGKVFGVSGAIIASRVLGLLRVRLEAEVLGGGAIASAWHLAFALPNLLRRLLGEGALGNALMPIVAEIDEKEGTQAARGALAVVFPCLGALLGAIVLLVAGAALIAGRFIPAGADFFRWRLVCHLVPILMPYGIFICLIGAATAVVNYARIFIFPAFCSLSMNIFLVGGLLWGWYTRANAFPEKLEEFLSLLSCLFLISGIVQLALTLLALKFSGFMPDFRNWRPHKEVLGKLWRLAAPGIVGAGAVQISFLVDRTLALWVNDQGVAALTYVDRLIDLPIAVFGVAMGQVLMARMTRSAAEGDAEGMAEEMNYGLRQLLFLCIPLAAGVIFFHELMLKVICLGGSYSMKDLDAARSAAVFYGCGVPCFCALKIIQPAFFARKDMKTPLYCSLTAIGVNIVVSIALIRPLAQGGIALATVISSLINNALLFRFLMKAGVHVEFSRIGATLLRSVCAALGAGFGVKYLADLLYHGSGRLADFCALAVAGSVFMAVYLLVSHLTGGREAANMLGRFRK